MKAWVNILLKFLATLSGHPLKYLLIVDLFRKVTKHKLFLHTILLFTIKSSKVFQTKGIIF